MKLLNANKIKLGEYLVLPLHNKLLLDERELKLEPKIMQVLCYLMTHKGHVVSRQQIAEGLWPDTTKGLEVVTRAIFELRKILDDAAKKPRFIETIARKGYVFIHEFELLDKTTTEPNLISSRISDNHSRMAWLVALSLACILFSLFILVWPIKQQDKIYQTNLLTDSSVYANMHSVSPAWDKVIFVRSKSADDPFNQLVLLDLNTQKQHVISEMNGRFLSPVWANDSQYWLYIKCWERQCDVIKHQIEDGHQETIYSSKQSIESLALSPDQSQIALSIMHRGAQRIATLQLTERNKTLDYISVPDSPNNLPKYDSNGAYIYFISQTARNAVDFYQYDLNKKTYKSINTSLDTIWGFTAKSDGELWITGRRDGHSAIWTLNLVDQKLNKIIDHNPEELLAGLTVASDGGNFIYESRARDVNFAQLGIGERLDLLPSNSNMIDMKALYSTERDSLYFVSNRSGVYEVWNYHARQSEKLTHLNANMIERPILSKQQNQLAFVARLNASKQVIIYDLQSKTITNKIQIPKVGTLLSWSNRSNIIYFTMTENGQEDIYELNVLTGNKTKILLNASILAQESDDGKQLYYVDIANWQIMQKDQNGEVTSKLKLDVNDGNLLPHQINILDKQVFYILKKNSQNTLISYSFEDKSTVVHNTLPNNAYVTQIGQLDKPFLIYDYRVKDKSKLIHKKKIYN